MITFTHVTYTYPQAPQPALHDLSLTIAEGNFVLVVGASGSGKSTFLRCINGLVPHFYGGSFAGSVQVAGFDTRLHEPRDLASTVGFVFQDPEAQMVVEIVEDELVFGMENCGVERRVMQRRVEEVLDQLEIAHLRRRRVTTLSGGERQRVAIAAVLALQPQVLVLDEPTSQLDPHTAEEVLTSLQKLNADLGLTIVLSEHRLERVVQYADQIIRFERHADRPPIVSMGTPREMMAHSPIAPPLVQLGRALNWQPLPLTIKEGRTFVLAHHLDQPVEPLPSTRPLHRFAGLLPPRRAQKQESADQTPVLSVDRLSVGHAGVDVLHEISLGLARGELVAIMGRNGAGKTTLLRAIMGLLTPSYGRVIYDGKDISRLPTEERARHIGYVPQDPRTLLFHETIADELRWTLAQHNIRAESKVAERIAQTLAQVRLTDVQHAHPREVSGGEQQRAALAAILVAEPHVLLLDEPTRGLDYESKAALVEILDDLKRSGRAIALVTHDVELVAASADRVVLLGDGEVVVAGSPQEILSDSLIFSSQIGKLFRRRGWLTVADVLAGLGITASGD